MLECGVGGQQGGAGGDYLNEQRFPTRGPYPLPPPHSVLDIRPSVSHVVTQTQ